MKLRVFPPVIICIASFTGLAAPTMLESTPHLVESARLSATGRIADIGFSPDGKSIVTLSDTDGAQIWDLASSKLIVSLGRHTSTGKPRMPGQIRFSSQTEVLARIGEDVVIYDVSTSQKARVVPIGNRPVVFLEGPTSDKRVPFREVPIDVPLATFEQASPRGAFAVSINDASALVFRDETPFPRFLTDSKTCAMAAIAPDGARVACVNRFAPHRISIFSDYGEEPRVVGLRTSLGAIKDCQVEGSADESAFVTALDFPHDDGLTSKDALLVAVARFCGGTRTEMQLLESSATTPRSLGVVNASVTSLARRGDTLALGTREHGVIILRMTRKAQPASKPKRDP